MFRLGTAAAFAACGLLLSAYAPASIAAEGFAPYGVAKARGQGNQPLKYVFESSSFDPAEVADTLRVARQVLSLSPKGSEMVVVVIGGGIRVFATENYEK